MAMPNSTASGSRTVSAPSADSLAFSAQLYTSQISSWIPADFGHSYKPPASTSESFLTTSGADRDERLGIGHPSLEVPKHRRHENTQLEKLLGLNKGKGKGKAEADDGMIGKGVGEEEEEEEEESRGRIGKKRMIGTVDLLAGKKKSKAKAKTKMEMEDQAIPKITSQSQPEKEELSLPEHLVGSKLLDEDTMAKQEPKTKNEGPPDEITTSDRIPPNTTTDLLTKNQRKKMRKRQKKLALDQNEA